MRVGTGRWGRGPAALAVLVSLLVAQAACAYSGNVPWMMWDCLVRQCKGKFGRTNGISKIAVKHLRHEGFSRCTSARVRMEARLANEGISAREREWVENEIAFISAREAFLQGLMDTTLYWRDQTFEQEGYGTLGQSLIEIRLMYNLGLEPLLLEREAARVQFADLDFVRSQELLEQALALRRNAIELVEVRIAALETGEEPQTPEWVTDPAATEWSDDDKLPWPGDKAARLEYLRFHLTQYKAHTDALQAEVDASENPQRLLAMAAYFAAREELGGSKAEFRHRGPQIAGRMPQSEFYLRKAMALLPDGAEVDLTTVPMAAPDWYLATVYEPGWYNFRMKPWEVSDDDSR